MDTKSQGVVFLVREPLHGRKIHIPKSHHRQIIGKMGETLQKLEESTGTKIKVPGLREKVDLIEINGNRESVAKAVEKIRMISEKQSKQVTERLLIPKIYHPFMDFEKCLKSTKITNQNETDKESDEPADLQMPTVKIKVPTHYVMKNEVIVTGECDEVAKTAVEIQAQYEEILKLNYQTVTLKVEKDAHRFVIGPQRSRIYEIFEKTGVSVEVPLTESKSEIITLRGPLESLQEALKMVELNVENGKNSHSETVAVTTKQLEYVLNKSSLIHEIRDALNVKVVIPEPKGMNYVKYIKIVGTKEAIQDAKKRILTILENIPVSRDINIEPEHQAFIRKNRSFWKTMNADYPKTKIKLSEEAGDQPNQVTVTGPAVQVDEVNDILAHIVLDLINKSVSNEQAPRKKSIKSVGHLKKGEESEKIKISRRDPNNNTRIFTSSRNKDNNLATTTKISKKQSYNIRINPRVYSRIIGLMGRAVRKIEKDHKVRIQFPKPTDAIPDDVTIVGTDRHSIECARAVLVELEKRYIGEDSSGTAVVQEEGEKQPEKMTITTNNNEQ